MASAGLLLQPAWIFFFAGVSKLNGPAWLAGDALRTVLENDLWLRPLGEVLLGFPQLTGPLTWGTMTVELLAPLCLFAPLATRIVRPLGLLALWGFLAGMGLCISLGWIPWIMAAVLIPFVPAAVWDRLRPHPPEVDLSEVDEPEVVVGAQRDGWPQRTPWIPLEELWGDYRGKMFLHENIAFPQRIEIDGFLAWVCRHWDAEHPSLRAREATLTKVVRGPPGSEGKDGLRPVQSKETIGTRRRE